MIPGTTGLKLVLPLPLPLVCDVFTQTMTVIGQRLSALVFGIDT